MATATKMATRAPTTQAHRFVWIPAMNAKLQAPKTPKFWLPFGSEKVKKKKTKKREKICSWSPKYYLCVCVYIGVKKLVDLVLVLLCCLVWLRKRILVQWAENNRKKWAEKKKKMPGKLINQRRRVGERWKSLRKSAEPTSANRRRRCVTGLPINGPTSFHVWASLYTWAWRPTAKWIQPATAFVAALSWEVKINAIPSTFQEFCIYLYKFMPLVGISEKITGLLFYIFELW